MVGVGGSSLSTIIESKLSSFNSDSVYSSSSSSSSSSSLLTTFPITFIGTSITFAVVDTTVPARARYGATNSK